MRARAVPKLVIAALFLTPLALMAVGSLRPPGLPPPDGLELWAGRAAYSNYDVVFDLIPMGRQLVNSLMVVLVAVPVTVVVASLAGFAIVTSSARRRRALIAWTVVIQMVPLTALWVPRFVIFEKLGLTDTLVPLVAPALMATSPLFVAVFALAYARLPKDVLAAARLDGWSPLDVWRKVAFPLARPAAGAVAVLAFAYHWANLIDPLIYLSDTDRYTVPLGLRSLQTLEPANFPFLLATGVIATIPAVLVFLMGQRAFFRKVVDAV
jgi:multiple sugar transport system permease protein